MSEKTFEKVYLIMASRVESKDTILLDGVVEQDPVTGPVETVTFRMSRSTFESLGKPPATEKMAVKVVVIPAPVVASPPAAP